MGRLIKSPSFPLYLFIGALALLLAVCGRRLGWEGVLFSAPVVYAAVRAFRAQCRQQESDKAHADELASLHFRAIEALSLAIEAKDSTTHDHLQRVQVYCMELGRKLNLDKGQLMALRAAAILHDVGKIAVPEYIISKPGKLTSEEFDKMRIHPVVGAEIVECVRFPYEVAPIVRAHHERWNGTGYPDGLKGEEIPIGARILSVVDCLDALASDRQYRRALPLDEAMAVIVAESGRSYDPQVVEVLRQNYREWEQLARAAEPTTTRLSWDPPTALGGGPAAGLQVFGAEDNRNEFLAAIANARTESQTLHDLTLDLGQSANLDETFAVLDRRLHRLIPYDAIAVYLCEENQLTPRYVAGEDGQLFSTLRIPIGQGLSGWVADTGKPILNGNPAVEPAYLNDPSKISILRSALAVPLESPRGIAGVLSLYRLAPDAFNKDHLRILLAIKPKVAQIVEQANDFRAAAGSEDPTHLHTAATLIAQLSSRLESAREMGKPVAVLVCALEGVQRMNERFGHQLANHAILTLAGRLRESCRGSDFVSRMGGDEIVLLLPGFRAENLADKLTALRKAAASTAIGVVGEPVLDLRLGAAFFPEDGDNAERLLAEAGRRLYLARHARGDSAPREAVDLAHLAALLEQAGRTSRPESETARPPVLTSAGPQFVANRRSRRHRRH